MRMAEVPGAMREQAFTRGVRIGQRRVAHPQVGAEHGGLARELRRTGGKRNGGDWCVHRVQASSAAPIRHRGFHAVSMLV